MNKIAFKCKGKLDDGKPCPETVKVNPEDSVTIFHARFSWFSANDEGDSKSPTEFTLKCSRGHRHEYEVGEAASE